MRLLDNIASIVSGAGAILMDRRQGEPCLDQLDLQARQMGSPEGYPEPELAVAFGHTRPQQRPVEEAVTDGLTGLRAHRYFMEALDRERRRSARTGLEFSLILMRLDGFQRINGNRGEQEGDKVLTVVAALLDAGSRRPSFLARHEKDKFAILMPGTNRQQAETLAEELRVAVEGVHFPGAHEVTASVGTATFPDHGLTQEEILRHAASGMRLGRHHKESPVKVASLSPTPGDAERDEQRLEAHPEAAVKGTFSPAPDAFSSYLRQLEQIKPLLDSFPIFGFSIEPNGSYPRGHSQAVSWLAIRIAIQMGLSPAEIEEICLGGLLHDIGKFDLPDDVFTKATLLTAAEFEIMKSHAVKGENMLKRLKLKGIGLIVRHHHERYDGQGYPDGLAGDEIPLGARIVAVAECFEDMVTDLPYKGARTFENAVAELRRCSGTQFDPRVVTAFLDWLQFHGDPREVQASKAPT